MLARRSALEQIRMPEYQGPFDESFFMFSEEVDLCHRLKDADWRIAYRPLALVIHYVGRSSDQEVAARHINFNSSKIRYYQKYFGNGCAWMLRQFLLMEFRCRLLTERFKGLLGHKREMRHSRVLNYKQVLASGLKPRPSRSTVDEKMED